MDTELKMNQRYPAAPKGFLVKFREEAKGIGITFDYFVPYGLSLLQKKGVALTIMREVSIAFEQLQIGRLLTGERSSHFEVSDLVSNQLGLYARMEGLTKNEILNDCGKVTSE